MGHEVTYVTRDYGSERLPSTYKVIAVDDNSELYGRDGNRKVWPAVKFALRAFMFTLKARNSYDLFYVAQSPLWPVITVSCALVGRRSRLVVEWLEWWPLQYWLAYSGRVKGLVGYTVQRVALALSPRITTYTDLTLNRLLSVKISRQIVKLPGMFSRELHNSCPRKNPASSREPVVLFVGRLVPEKRPQLALEVMASVCGDIPGVVCVMAGQGPLLEELRATAVRLGLPANCVRGGVSEMELELLWEQAAVLLHPSAREGYGLVLAEAFASGTPVVVVRSGDNAATELVDDQCNGIISESIAKTELVAGVKAILSDRESWSERSYQWFLNEYESRSSRSSAARIVELSARNGSAPELPQAAVGIDSYSLP